MFGQLSGLSTIQRKVEASRKHSYLYNTDAEAAARAALNGEATAVPKSGDGPVEWIRMLTVTRRSAVKARTQAANQLHALVVGAPEPIKDQPRGHETQSPRPGVCPVPTERRVLCQLREAGSPPPGLPLPGPRHRDRRARCRDQTPLRQGQPGPVGRRRRRSRHSRQAASRSRRQPRAYEIGAVLRCAVRCQPCPGVVWAKGAASS